MVTYDELMHSVALELGLISPKVDKRKTQVRDAIRQLPDGEVQWQKLQGTVYGPRMNNAKLTEGSMAFFQDCGRRGARVYVVSHKTEFNKYDETQTNLRSSAMAWMETNGFFDSDGFSLERQDIFMEGSRQAKLQRIDILGCTHFIDDLEEVFREPEFPKGVQGILYAPNTASASPPGVKPASCWKEISEYIFGK